MYSWAQCTMQERLVCSRDVPWVAQEERGFGPSTLSTYPFPIYLGAVGTQFTSNLGPRWTGSYHAKEGFQVSEREVGLKQQGIGKWSKRQGDCAIIMLSICIHVYNNRLNVECS